MMLDTRLLKCFAVVAEELHFGRAAQRLCMTQPPLSQSIRALETQLQAQLLTRTTRAVRLTPAGEVLKQRITVLEHEMRLTIQSVQATHKGIEGTLRIALTPSAAYSTFPQCLHAFRQTFPNVVVDLQEMNSSDMPEALRQGRLDMALIRPPFAHATLEPLLILSEPLMLAIRKDHPVAQRCAQSISLAQALKCELVGYSRQSSRYFHDVLQQLALKAQSPLHITQESMIPTILALVEAGFGAAFVPATMSRARSDTLTYLTVTGCGDIRAELLVVKAPDHESVAVANMLKIIHEFTSSPCTDGIVKHKAHTLAKTVI